MNNPDHELSNCSGISQFSLNKNSLYYPHSYMTSAHPRPVVNHGNIAITHVPNTAAHALPHVVHCMADIIPQVDGPPPSVPLPCHSQLVPPQLDQQQNIRRANYSLDRAKQVSRLCKDTKIDDFDITVSPIAHNVTIKCSTGFYTKVALPTFTGMSLHYKCIVNGVEIQCIKIDGQVDETGATVTDLIKFELKYEEARDKPTLGTVVVHLHHTARKVQLQGSSLVHGQVRAPVWFVDYFLKGIFSFYAREKAVDISRFNEVVHDMLNRHVEKLNTLDKCGVCGHLLTGRSLPVSCPTCARKFHKNCSTDKEHECARSPATPRPPHSQTWPPVSTSTVPAPTTKVPSTTLINTQLLPPVSSVGSSSTMSSASLSLSSTSVSTSFPHHSPIVTTTATNPTMNPFASSFLPSSHHAALPPPPITSPSCQGSPPQCPIISQPPPPPPPPPPIQEPSRPKATKKKSPPPPPQNLSLEFARIELNTAQAANVVLETTVKDLRFRNGLLEDRVKQLEAKKKDDIFERYFPSSSSTSGHPLPQTQNCPAQPDRHQHCCQRSSHCFPLTCNMVRCLTPCNSLNTDNSFPAQLNAAIEDLKAAFNVLKADMDEIKTKLVQQNLLPSPPVQTGNITSPLEPNLPTSSHSFSPQSPSQPIHSSPPYSTTDPICFHTNHTQHTQNLNSSIASLEQEISETEDEIYLNCE